MSLATYIDILLVAVVFALVLYWIFVAPERARKRRRIDSYGQTGHFRAWDPNIASRKRER